MDVYARGGFSFPAAMGLDFGKGPARESEVGGTTVFECIPCVGRDIGLFAFGFEPCIECSLVDGEDFVCGGMGAGGGEEGEGIEGRRK